MAEPEPPRIEFPCRYPVTVVAAAGGALREQVFAVFELHAPGFDRAAVIARASRNGNYQSLRFTITATGEAQLRSLFEGLKACPGVHLVL
ncbi:MAG: YbeD family protein [Pseudomonadota bacterium]